VLDTVTEKDFRKRSNSGGDVGTGVYMREGTASRAMAADRPYGVFYDFYSVSPEYFGLTLVYLCFFGFVFGFKNSNRERQDLETRNKNLLNVLSWKI
jgi:hypothetical protein